MLHFYIFSFFYIYKHKNHYWATSKYNWINFFSVIIVKALNKDQGLIQIKWFEKVKHIESSQRDTHGVSVTMTDGSLDFYMMLGTLLKMFLCHFRNLRKIFSNDYSLIKGNVGKYHLILSADGQHRSLIKTVKNFLV